jgi:hypothetical protein
MKPRLYLCLVILLALVSCGSLPVSKDDLGEIRQGLSQKECWSKLHAEPARQFVAIHDGVHFSVDVYNMTTETTASTMNRYAWTKYGVLTFPETIYSSKTNDYAFIYDQTGLIYWGFIKDLYKANEQLIRKLSPLIASENRELKEAHFLDGAPAVVQDNNKVAPSKHSDEADQPAGDTKD